MPDPASIADELIAVPAGSRVFSLDVHAGLGDCAPSRRARLDAIARWLQDVAYGDVNDAGLSETSAWVVRRARIVVRRWPRFGDRLRADTFCSGVGRMWAERRTSLTSTATLPRPGRDPDRAGVPPEPDVDAVALWIHLDPATYLPTILTEREIAVYGGAVPDRRIRHRLRHDRPPADATASAFRFRAADMDVAAHVNNAAYWTVVEEELATIPEPATFDAEIEFRGPAQPGPMRILAEGALLDGGRRWIVAPDSDELHASIIVRSNA